MQSRLGAAKPSALSFAQVFCCGLQLPQALLASTAPLFVLSWLPYLSVPNPLLMFNKISRKQPERYAYIPGPHDVIRKKKVVPDVF